MIEEHPHAEGDLWALHRVTLESVRHGEFPVVLALRLVERVFHDPWSHARAHLLGGEDHWQEWLGYTPETQALKDLADLFIAANTDKKKKPQTVPRPTNNAPVKPSVGSLAEAFRLLSTLQQT